MLEEERIMNLKRELIEYATLVEGMIDKSIKGLVNKDKVLLIQVIEEDEPKANHFEVKLDELCTVLIAQYQPKAKALRTILMSLKINNDLERMADHAVNIGETSLDLIGIPTTKFLSDILKMAEVTRSMLADSIDAFVREDGKLAKEVCERDSIVDELRDRNRKEIINAMCADCGMIGAYLNFLRIARNLERIADLSTNLGEDVIFMVEGRVIKHRIDST
ncbi:MAG: phosphate signaling complex protein PhoU [Pseudomonadota bacterium]